MNIVLLILFIILLVAYMIFLSQHKDRELLRVPPVTEKLPRYKYDQALVELNEFSAQPKPRTRQGQLAKSSERHYLELKLKQILNQTEEEQRNYYIACKECEIAWQDYYDIYNNMNVFDRTLSFEKIRELRLIRKLYLETKQKVGLEKEKLVARGRVKRHEEKNINEREEEIERKTRAARVEDTDTTIPQEGDTENTKKKDEYQLPNDPDSSRSSDPAAIRDALEEISLSDDSMNGVTPVDDVPGEVVKDSLEENPHVVSTGNDHLSDGHFGQEDFAKRYPEFSRLTYVDESFSIEELDFKIIRDAKFDGSFFVSTVFNGVHQYQNCSFTHTDFSNSIWQRSNSPHRILNCDFSNSKFAGATLEFVAFYNCRFVETNFLEATLKKVKFVNCGFESCRIQNVDFSETVMSMDMLEKIDFSDCLRLPKNYTVTSPNTDHQNAEAD
ncbi:MAG: pentapeptide repeat-containing protein [Proteobacteria bacterium]|nr:pentapeptide repeat-containing protein [Pseudomonadota bacterium]